MRIFYVEDEKYLVEAVIHLLKREKILVKIDNHDFIISNDGQVVL